MINLSNGVVASPVFSRRGNPREEVRLLVHPSTPREAFTADLANVHTMNSTYMTLRYHAPIYARALAAAAEQIALRYPALASVFKNGPAGPAIVVGVGKRPVVEEYDVTSEPAETRERRAREIASQVICRPFESEAGPLFRLFCIKLAESDFVIGYVIHHLVCDHTSSMTVRRELMMLYYAHLQGLPVPQRRPALEYTDYLQATWDWLQTAVADSAKCYWQARLRDAPATRLAGSDKHNLYFDEGARLREFHIEGQVLQRLRQFGTERKIRLFVMCLTAKILAIAAISNSKDVTVAVLMTLRQSPQLVGVVGWLGNVLPIRVTLEANDSFEDAARKVEARLEEARRYLFYPYSFLEAIMKEVPASSIFPFFNYKENSVIAAPAESVRLAENFPIDFVQGTFVNGSHFFETMTSESGITGYLRYSPRLYSTDVVNTFLDLFTNILRSVPDEAVGPVPLRAVANL
jgi:condensation domain-containing protein